MQFWVCRCSVSRRDETKKEFFIYVQDVFVTSHCTYIKYFPALLCAECKVSKQAVKYRITKLFVSSLVPTLLF